MRYPPMRFQLVAGSRVAIELRATGLLRAIAHSPTLRGSPETLTVDYADQVAQAAVEALFRADAIELPSDMSASDRERMRDNLLGPEVLDAARFPTIAFRGTYAGTLERGTLSGGLEVKGASRPIAIPIRLSREETLLFATGSWEGKLTDLGIRPFKALLGAIKLQDWIALRVEARFRG
jgi:polyisoprenoid-binding protein YceI